MKNFIVFLSLLILGEFQLFSQTPPGSLIFNEDFNGGLPSTWSIVNKNANNITWIWGTDYKNGMFSNCDNNISSSSTKNGFMMLPLDFYNTPIPASITHVDSYIESPSFTIPGSGTYLFRCQQFFRYCCNTNSKMELQVSLDNFITFQSYSFQQGLSPNMYSPNSMDIHIPFVVSNSAATTMKFRIVAEGMSHYFWMIDDVEIVVPYTSAVTAENFEIETSHLSATENIKPSVPLFLIDPITSKLNIWNRGSGSQLNTKVKSNLYLDSNLNGQAINSIISEDSAIVFMTASQGFNTTSITNSVIPSSFGHYRIQNEIKTQGTNQISNRKSKEVSFVVSDSVLSKNTIINNCLNNHSINSSPKLGTIYSMGNNSAKLTSISAYIDTTSIQDSSYVKAELWSFSYSSTGITLRNRLDSSQVDTISGSLASEWMTFPMINSTNLLADSSYLVVLSLVGRSSQFSRFTMPGYLNLEEVKNANPSSFTLNSTTNIWEAEYENFYMNLNVKTFTTGIVNFNSDKINVSIHPNPSNGIYFIQSDSKIRAIQIFNINGKLIKNGTSKSFNTINLLNQNDGVYIIKIETEKGEWISKKVLKN